VTSRDYATSVDAPLAAWLAFPAYVLMFLMLVFPMVFALIFTKGLLFAVVLLTVFAVALRTGQIGLHSSVVGWTFFLATISFLFVLEGFFASAPGATRQSQTYVLWPLIYLSVIAGVRHKRIFLGLADTIAFSTICIALYSIVYTLIQTKILPESSQFDLISFDWQAQAFGLHEGYLAMQFPGLNSLPFLIPFLFALLITFQPADGNTLVRRAQVSIAACLGLTTVLMSGRRALYLATIASPLLIFLFTRFQPRTDRQCSSKRLTRVTALALIASVVLLFGLNAMYGVSLSGLADRLSMGFDFSPTAEDTGTTERRVQFHALLAGWTENPLLGAGHGAPVFGSIRSEESPWNYELYYMALLYQTGALGFAAYSAGIIWIYWTGIRVIRAGGYLSALMIACLVGFSSILVANATNPYLARYDAMWAIFLPLAVINFWLLRRPLPSSPTSAAAPSSVTA
jgi:hypothetical protein